MNPAKIDEVTSYQIWVLKIIAIFTIFFAHMPVSEATLNISFQYSWLSRLYSLLGMVGVPIFMFLSGYLYKKGNLKKRAVALLIPLVIWGSVTYLLHCAKDGLSSFSFIDYLLWIVGSNCYLYFVTVLFAIILLYHFFDNDYVYIVLSLLSIGLYEFHIIRYTTIFTPYLNPLNFIAYFALGHLFRRHSLWARISKGNIVISWFCALVITLLFIARDYYVHVWYFDLISVVVNILVILLCLNFTGFIRRTDKHVIILGKCTYVIYLCHMPIATTLNKFIPNYLYGFSETLKIIVAFGIVVAGVLILRNILNHFKRFKLMSLLGYRV